MACYILPSSLIIIFNFTHLSETREKNVQVQKFFYPGQQSQEDLDGKSLHVMREFIQRLHFWISLYKMGLFKICCI